MKNFILKSATATIILTLIFSVLAFSQPTDDDIYYTSSGTKIKKLKNRKEYTPIKDRTPQEGKSLYFKSEPTNSYVNYNEDTKEVYMYIFLQGQDYTSTAERPAYNFSFVIDRSGSMQGDKLKYTKEALNYVINQLGDNDFVSVVKYNDEVEVVSKPVDGSNAKRVAEKIKELVASGSTNLCGGMEKGFELIGKTQKSNDEHRINRVFLLSDGLANVGTIQPDEIAKIARKMYQSNNFTISTLGVGADYNENLMTKVSMEGGGNYHFIDSPKNIEKIFAKELFGLKSLIATDAVLEIEFPYNQVKFDKVYDYPYVKNENKIKIKLSDVFANEQKAILIKFKLRDSYDGNVEFISNLTYKNIVNNNTLVSEKSISTIKQTNKKQDLIDGLNPNADMGYTLMVSTDYLEKAQRAVDNRRFAEANELVEQGTKVIEKHFAMVKPNPYLEDIYDELKEYKTEIVKLKTIKNITKFKLIQKKSKHRNYSSKYGSVRFL